MPAGAIRPAGATKPAEAPGPAREASRPIRRVAGARGPRWLLARKFVGPGRELRVGFPAQARTEAAGRRAVQVVGAFGRSATAAAGIRGAAASGGGTARLARRWIVVFVGKI